MSAPPLPGRRARRRVRTAEDIVAAAAALFAEQGWAATTMEQIAARADVAKATLYSHFPVKEAILVAQMQQELRAHWPAFETQVAQAPDTRAQLLALFALAVPWLEAHRDVLGAYVGYRLARPRGGPEQRSGMERLFAGIVEAGVARGELRADLPAERLAAHLQFAYLAEILRWLEAPEGTPALGRALADLVDLFLDGAGSRPETRDAR